MNTFQTDTPNRQAAVKGLAVFGFVALVATTTSKRVHKIVEKYT